MKLNFEEKIKRKDKNKRKETKLIIKSERIEMRKTNEKRKNLKPKKG
jgi:hypothetical protein